jgi:isopenicillin N synthase-like dioxygenase
MTFRVLAVFGISGRSFSKVSIAVDASSGDWGTGMGGNFYRRCVSDVSELRPNHYPTVTRQELAVRNTRCIWPHPDTGLFSFVFQGNDRGLQVEDRKSPGRFVIVLQRSADEMILNVADTLERWTNGNLRA